MCGGATPNIRLLAPVRFARLLVCSSLGFFRLQTKLSHVGWGVCVLPQVACRSDADGCVYFNALVLLQQACFDPRKLPLDAPAAASGLRGGGAGAVGGAASWDEWRVWMVPPGGPTDVNSTGVGASANGVATAAQRRCWLYWLERSAAALGHGPPTGLYDPIVRRRFKALVGDSLRTAAL
jgi:hypothetical protein